jgi:acyl-coenzyme A synthetase/AMP-(fatty) acid ligase
MIYRELLHRQNDAPDWECVRSGSESLSFRRFYWEVEARAASLESHAEGRIGLCLEDGWQQLAWCFACDKLGCDVFLFGPDQSADFVAGALDELGIELCLTDRETPGSSDRFRQAGALAPMVQPAAKPAPNRSGEGQVILFTSGTSGKPKGAVHTWQSLAAGIKVDPRFQRTRWLLTYGLTRFAGIQVFLQAFLNSACLALARGSPSEMIHAVATEGAEYISGTPTFWRKVLASIPLEDLRRLPVRQVTLGGEIVAQGVLNMLRSAFPEAQITHIYASTEMGACFSVRDGLEGFSVELLDGNSGVKMKIVDAELYIQSGRAMKKYLAAKPGGAEEWFATGDLVEIRDGRVCFLGRRSEIINVGGAKVYPAEVEEQIRAVPGVREARVFGTKSSFAGSLVSAEIVAAPQSNQDELKQRIFERCQANLPPHKRPRLIQFVEQLKETASKKLARQ